MSRSTGILGWALVTSCGGSSLRSDAGPGGGSGGGGAADTGGNSGAGCQAMHYQTPGCNSSPTCDNGTGGDCFSLACGCNGKVLAGCGQYSDPFAYTIPVTAVDASNPAELSCDPDAGAFGASYACAGGYIVTADGGQLPGGDAATSMSCVAGITYCSVHLPHPDLTGRVNAECAAVPAVCAHDPTCACLCDPARGNLFCKTNCRCTDTGGAATISCEAI